MAQLIIKNLEDNLVARLHQRAKRHRRSIEEEVRDILRSAAAEEVADAPLGTRISARFAGIGLDHQIEEMRSPILRSRKP